MNPYTTEPHAVAASLSGTHELGTVTADGLAAAINEALGSRSIVLIGMMGAGKTSVGRRLAHRLGLLFVDADAEIEAAHRMSIAEIFAKHGEAYFRDGERRVIGRLLSD